MASLKSSIQVSKLSPLFVLVEIDRVRVPSIMRDVSIEGAAIAPLPTTARAAGFRPDSEALALGICQLVIDGTQLCNNSRQKRLVYLEFKIQFTSVAGDKPSSTDDFDSPSAVSS